MGYNCLNVFITFSLSAYICQLRRIVGCEEMLQILSDRHFLQCYNNAMKNGRTYKEGTVSDKTRRYQIDNVTQYSQIGQDNVVKDFRQE